VVEAKEPDSIESSGSPLETMPTLAPRESTPLEPPMEPIPPKMPLVETRHLPVPIRQALFDSNRVPTKVWVPPDQDPSSFPPPVDSTAMRGWHYLLPSQLGQTTYAPAPGSAPYLGAHATATSDECLHVSARDKGKGKAREMPDDECGGSSSHRRWRDY